MSRGKFSCSLHGLPLGDIPCRQCLQNRNDPKRLANADRIVGDVERDAEERRLSAAVVEAAMFRHHNGARGNVPLGDACAALAAFRAEQGRKT